MQHLTNVFTFWLFYAIVATVSSVPVMLFVKRNVALGWWSILGLVLPPLCWILTSAILERHFKVGQTWPPEKGMFNYAAEPALLGVATPIFLFLYFKLCGSKNVKRGRAELLLMIFCLTGIFIALFTPNLGGHP